MADYGSLQSPKNSSFFSSPRLFNGFVSKNTCESELIMSSPTSILETKPYTAFKNPFWSDSNSPKTLKPDIKNLWEKRGVGLGIVDSLIDDKSESSFSKPDSRMVLFGSQLKIQVPPLPPSVLSPPNSPSDFGIKTRNSHVGSFSTRSSTSPVKKSSFGSSNSCSFSTLSASEMEMSEDYTCVISYGPNPRTTHIFDDCIVKSCCGVVKFSESRNENEAFSNQKTSYPSESFLSFCYNCKKSLGQGNDIYMYRGEKAFCSSDCRYMEMILDDDEDTN